MRERILFRVRSFFVFETNEHRLHRGHRFAQKDFFNIKQTELAGADLRFPHLMRDRRGKRYNNLTSVLF